MNNFEQQLKDAGYMKFNSGVYSALYGYEKKVRDEIGIKYAIHFFKYNIFQQNGFGEDKDVFDVKLQFQMSISVMNITLFSFAKNKTLEDIEEYIDELWEKLEAHYYEKY